MKNLNTIIRKAALAIVASAMMSLPSNIASADGHGNPNAQPPKIIQPGEKFQGKTYNEWAASFWQWMMGLPLEGHPAIDDPSFQFSAGQSGHVWYWAAPEGTISRTVTLPEGKALFLSIRD